MGNEQLLEKAHKGLETLPQIGVKHSHKPHESIYALKKFSDRRRSQAHCRKREEGKAF